MKTDFNNISQHIIPMEKFCSKWRFTDDSFEKIPAKHLEQFKPLNDEGAKFLWDFISATELHSDVPFKKDFFHTIDKAKISDNNSSDIKKWLYQRALPFDKPVYISWQPNEAMIVPWKMLIKYYQHFYSGGDDLTVIDESLNWSLLFYHEDEIYFGTNISFEQSTLFQDADFIW